MACRNVFTTENNSKRWLHLFIIVKRSKWLSPLLIQLKYNDVFIAYLPWIFNCFFVFFALNFSLIDRRGYVVPDSSQIHSDSSNSCVKESNSVNVKHEYYGSTTVTEQKVISFFFFPTYFHEKSWKYSQHVISNKYILNY